ncbi:MAG: EamA family transporter [bacterium]|nr:EamA family transporter [bacterium]
MKIIFPILAILCYGISPVIQKSALKRISLPNLFTVHGITIFFVYISIFVLFRDHPINNGIIWAIFSGISSVVGFLFYYEALKKGRASVVTAVSSSYALFTVILSVIFLKEKIFMKEIIGIILIIIGIVNLELINVKSKDEENKEFGVREGIFTVIAMLCWGAWAFFTKTAVAETGEINTLMVFGVMALVVFPIYATLIKKKSESPEKNHSWKIGILIAIISVLVIGTASFSFYFSVEHYRISILTPLVSMYPAVTVITSIIFIKEKVTFLQIFFIILIIFGVILLS